ncbi:Primosomal protein N' (replication factor Y) - superfamily II helicase [Lachnospiraceae bacterium TWA4]|nr:Primosomal protein N' (replication factor Y) - superfamily II helicase [Lachnospiraceae bacterium TWA4]
MSDKIFEYKCPACAGVLHFDPVAGKLKCDFCDSTYTTDEIEKFYNISQDSSKKNPKKGSPKEESVNEWDTSNLNREWDETMDNMSVYNCPSCGAELICETTEASLTCPYCGNATVVFGQFAGDLRPDYIIPFKLDKNKAKKALKRYYLKKPLLPKEFSSRSTIDKIQGIYVPFWFFDGEVSGDIRFICEKHSTHRDGDYEVTETEFYRVERGGKFPFQKIPVDASKKMPDDLMDSIEPFNYEELEPFSESYLPGFMASRYDVGVEESFKRAEKRVVQTADDILGSDIVGYSSKRVESQKMHVKKGQVHYGLLPVYILTIKWKQKEYLFAMNGQTGKFIGDLPIDERKRKLIFGVTIFIPSILVTLLRISFLG